MSFLSKAQQLAAQLTALEKDEEQLRLEREAEPRGGGWAWVVSGQAPPPLPRPRSGIAVPIEASRIDGRTNISRRGCRCNCMDMGVLKWME